MRLAVDLMGSDASPSELIHGVIAVARTLAKDIQINVLAICSYAKSIEEAIAEADNLSCSVTLTVVEECIQMEELPLQAIKNKPNSSISYAIRGLSDGSLDAYVTAGNSGVLLAAAALMLPKWQGIDRPALLVEIPTLKKSTVIIDVGASSQCRLRHMLQYSAMGIAYSQVVRNIKKPTVGILNIGKEAVKGQLIHRDLYRYLSDSFHLKTLPYYFPESTFIGNIEGREALEGCVDVLVADGFSGNLFLKSSEGACRFVIEKLREKFHSAVSKSNLDTMNLDEELNALQMQLSHLESSGALLCGIRGLILKCPGTGSSNAFGNAIKRSVEYVQNDILNRIEALLIKQDTLTG